MNKKKKRSSQGMKRNQIYVDGLCDVDACHKKFGFPLQPIEKVRMTISEGGHKLGGYSSFFVGEFEINNNNLEEGLSSQEKKDGEPT